MKRCDHRSNQTKRMVVIATMLLSLAIFAGCFQDYGRLQRNDQITKDFRRGAAPQSLTYFYTGRKTMPYAIMGIDPAYTISSAYWTAFEPQPELLRSMARNIYGNVNYSAYGFDILAPDGTFVGIWYSSIDFVSFSVDQQARTVAVSYSNPENNRYY